MHKHLYSHFLLATQKKGLTYFTAHSHHFWPDVSREAVLKCWDDASRLVDDKWDLIFDEYVPKAQRYVAEMMGIRKEKSQLICIATNTHEFVVRLLSCLDSSKSIKILTTDSEFISFERQVSRMEERDNVSVTRVPVMPFETFLDRFQEKAVFGRYDMVFFSQVFFNSGLAVNPEKTVYPLKTLTLLLLLTVTMLLERYQPGWDLLRTEFFIWRADINMPSQGREYVFYILLLIAS